MAGGRPSGGALTDCQDCQDCHDCQDCQDCQHRRDWVLSAQPNHGNTGNRGTHGNSANPGDVGNHGNLGTAESEHPLEVHLIDGTYELFRYFYAVPSARDADGREVGAVRAVVGSVLGMINRGATHVAVATDHVIESFRNGLWPGYKTGAGIDPDLFAQFGLLEDALAALGVTVWPMIEFEADDALAAGAVKAAEDPGVDRVIVCTPDKDLAQSVRGTRVVQMNRRTNVIRDEAGVIAKFGVAPESIPDYLALVGDAADGYPGLPGWGAKSSAAVLARYRHLETIPDDFRTWGVNAASPGALALTLARDRHLAMLFRQLATLRTDIPLFESVEELRWTGPTAAFRAYAERFDAATIGSAPRR
jgi:5'-3' exonuclease